MRLGLISNRHFFGGVVQYVWGKARSVAQLLAYKYRIEFSTQMQKGRTRI